MRDNKISVRLDLDGVLNTFDQHVVDLHYQKTGEKVKADQWGFHENSEYGEDLWSVTKEPNFFYTCPVQDHAVEMVKYLENNVSIYEYFICSSYVQGFGTDIEYVEQQKRQWLYELFGDFAASKLHLVEGSKTDYPADIIVDDYFKNIEEADDDCLKIFFRQPHNKDIDKFDDDPKVITDIKDHKALIELFKKFSMFGSVEEFVEDYHG